MRGVVMLAVLGLAGCQAGLPASSTSSGLPGLSIVPGPGGLLVEGSGGREIGFGRDQKGALETIARIEGLTPRPFECAPGRQAFITQSALRIVFEAGKFVGWSGVNGSAGRDCN